MRSFMKRVAAFVLLQLLFIGVASAVNQAPVATMTGPAPGVQFNGPAAITLSATASDPDGSVAKVEFYSGTTLLGPGVTTAPYTFAWSNVVAGTYSITAKAYDNLGKTGSSAAIQVKVINPTTVITSPAADAIVGRTVAVNGTYTGDNATVVIVTAGAGHSTVASSGTQSFSANVELARGANTIEVQVARADGTFEIVDRSVTAVDPPVVVMTAPASNGPYTAPAQLSLAADAASAQGTIAKVEFFDSTTSLGVATVAPYTATVSLPAANHSVFARATDSFGFTADSRTLPIVVQSQPPTAQITAPADGSTFHAPADISLTATASDPDGTVSRVDYFANGSFIGASTSAPYAVTWSSVAVGTYVITARATDNTGVSSADSTPVNVTVSNNLPPAVTLDAPSGSVSYSAPASINFSATASDSDGTVSKVEFLLNDVVVATASAPPYAQTATGIAAGSYVAKARATDNSGAVTTSSTTANVTVSPNAAPAVGISSPASGATFDTPANTTISATATDDGQVAQVQFFVNGASIGTATSSTTTFSVPWTNVGPGLYTLSAVATDNAGASTTSASVTVKVAMHTDPGETIVFLHNDFAGNPIAATDTTGTILWKEGYQPFGGRLVNSAASTSNRQWFAGKAADSDTGLSYFGARYYDPVVGRFTGVDPKAIDESKVNSLNRYQYGLNNPYRFIDTDGRSAAAIVGLTAGVVVAGITYSMMTPEQRLAIVTGLSKLNEYTIFGQLRNLILSEGKDADAGGAGAKSPGLPNGLVGSPDDKSGQQGNRVNSGPLDPAHGGTKDPEKDFDRLTGGKSGPAPAGSNYPEGTRIGENGISIRPGRGDTGPRIDIPANGSKPHETLHYP